METTTTTKAKPSPATQRALRAIAEQRKAAEAVDAALHQLVAARQRFCANGAAVEEAVRSMAAPAGHSLSAVEYDGAYRLDMWIRDRRGDPGFALFEERPLATLEQRVREVQEVIDAAE